MWKSYVGFRLIYNPDRFIDMINFQCIRVVYLEFKSNSLFYDFIWPLQLDEENNILIVINVKLTY